MEGESLVAQFVLSHFQQACAVDSSHRHVGVWLQASVKVRPGPTEDPEGEFSGLRTMPALIAFAWHREGLLTLTCCSAASGNACRW